jgi:hypothetical protein
LQRRVGGTKRFGFQHGECSLANQLRPTHAAMASQAVQARHQIVIELDQNLSSSHGHMLIHMVDLNPVVEKRFPNRRADTKHVERVQRPIRRVAAGRGALVRTR